MKRAEYDDLMSSAIVTAIDVGEALKRAKSEHDISLNFYKLWRMARRCQRQLIKRVGDVLLYCEDLINDNTIFFIDDVLILNCDDIIKGENVYLEDWHISFILSIRLMEFLLDVEAPQNIKKTKKFLRSKGVKVSRDEDVVELALEYEDYWACQEESKWPMPIRLSQVYGVFEYKICRRICKYLGFKSNLKEGELKRMYILVFIVCLYTAIRNELERLCNEMDDEGYEDVREKYGLPLDIKAEMQKLSKSVAKQPEDKEEVVVEFFPITFEDIDAQFDDIMTDKPKAFEMLTNKSGQTGPVEQPVQESATPPPEEKEGMTNEQEPEEEKNAEPTEERKQEIERVLTEHFNTDKARELFKRVMEAGLCDENYVWNKSKWERHDGDDVLALSYFAVRASDYLELKTAIIGRRRNTCWRPFHELFVYTGKRMDKYGKTLLQIVRGNYMKSNVEFIPLGSDRKVIDDLFP